MMLKIFDKPLSFAVYLPLIIIITVILSVSIPLDVCAHQCRFKIKDKRHLCLAQNEGASYFCRYITDKDQQHYCYAWTKRDPKRCVPIQDATFKQQCTVEAQARLDLMKTENNEEKSGKRK